MSTGHQRQGATLRQALRDFGRLAVLVKPYWADFWKDALLGFIIGALAMGGPFLSKLLIDEVYPSANVKLMEIIVLAMVGVGLSTVLATAIRGYYSQYVVSRISSATEILFFNHLQHQRARFFDEHQVGELASRFQDVTGSIGAVSRTFSTLFVNGVYLLLVPPLLLLLQWKLAIVALLIIPITAAITVTSGSPLRRYWARLADARAGLSAFYVEVLGHARTLKTMALERQVFQGLDQQVKSAARLNLTAQAATQVVGFLNGTASVLSTALVTYVAWMLILEQQMTLGDYFAFLGYMSFLYGPFAQIASLFSEFQQSSVDVGRMFEYLDIPPEHDPAAVYTDLPPLRYRIRGDLRFRNVSFGYQPDHLVLADVSLQISRASITAVVGPSGAGKSTLLRLLCRLEDPDAGEILFDGTPLGAIPHSDLRRQVSVLWQDDALLQRSLWDNLTLGTDDATKQRVDDAVSLCRLESLISELPAGYATEVAERGASLSAGQRQRLLIARAVIRDTPIILFDEATSNIDLETEAFILNNLCARFRQKTFIYVTHRVSSAALADRVCVLEHGRVAGYGSYAELLARCEVFQKLCLADGAARRPVRGALELSS